jgi:hypothetical protein
MAEQAVGRSPSQKAARIRHLRRAYQTNVGLGEMPPKPIESRTRLPRPSVNPELTAAEHWYGYGAWDAPYWFIGPEPGMANAEGDNLIARCNAWARLCKGHPLELIDCIDHHKAFHHMKFFERTIRMKHPCLDEVMRPPTQATWRRLITLLLAYLGERTDTDMVGQYQCTEGAD